MGEVPRFQSFVLDQENMQRGRKRKALKKKKKQNKPEELRRVREENAKGSGGQGDRRELVEKERGKVQPLETDQPILGDRQLEGGRGSYT